MLIMDKLFEEWYKQHYSPPANGDEFTYDDMRQAFEEGFHAAKDQLLDVLDYWAKQSETESEEPEPTKE